MAQCFKKIAKEFAKAAGLQVSRAAEELAAKYGDTPSEALVADLWPVMRDGWLAKTPGLHYVVVTWLRNARLGDLSIDTNTNEGQLNYLRSCRISKHMKEIVLHTFIKEYSSDIPGAIERDEALRLLAVRAILTRTVCRELLDSQGPYPGRRPIEALNMLLCWIEENYPDAVFSEPSANNGIDAMLVPDDCLDLLQEIRDGSDVCCALFMLRTADKSSEVEDDCKGIQKALETYWKVHAQPVVTVPWS